jgi:hypothetical protein
MVRLQVIRDGCRDMYAAIFFDGLSMRESKEDGGRGRQVSFGSSPMA